MTKLMAKLWKDDAGLTSVEYALLLVLVAIAAITAWTALGNTVNDRVNSVVDTMGS